MIYRLHFVSAIVHWYFLRNINNAMLNIKAWEVVYMPL